MTELNDLDSKLDELKAKLLRHSGLPSEERQEIEGEITSLEGDKARLQREL